MKVHYRIINGKIEIEMPQEFNEAERHTIDNDPRIGAEKQIRAYLKSLDDWKEFEIE